MRFRRRLALGGVGLLLIFSTPVGAAEKAQVTAAPNVPDPVQRTSPAKVVVQFEAKEYVGELADGKKYQFWSFNGTVPGPMVRVRAGDTVEFHLSNHKDSRFPHNIDIHAVNGPGGGAAVSLVAAGEEKVFQFKTLNPGLYIYHCASPAPNIPAHIANGMYGLILVEPEAGLPRVDREFYVLQSEFFTQPSDDDGVLVLSMTKGLEEHPDYVVFNGREGALVGEGALPARAGETVRIFFGNIGPNSASSFHIIGEIFDTVHVEGSLEGAVNHNVQTTLVPSAGAAIVEFKIDVPGDYLLVDHSIFRVAKGALGIIRAKGKDDPAVFQSIR
ncbi:MAG: nitrite reductase, copper-containing [Nitrospinaceae bacterium]|nr:nitrite reductase, copper-containing [Nitrospinaceae bacterium]NIR53631.1 nitrite reductase, copper-containing [Nitrospinaceae bacterium]NIS84037.1 nitrite reductase, copper-containing [Nitrospinaceae bacterium]NIT80838.1 nitrite reductase, copper-containing [Nitrospinaceae bacterium]NIU43147.1 nitrite reductase, copper-containing [Nitrospinaceae bacterium]